MIIPKNLIREIKKGNVLAFYNWSGWRKCSKELIKRNKNECQRCKAEGRRNKATVVHHIKHLRQYPALAMEESNLIPLCDTCHNKEHPEKLIKNKKEFMNEEWF